MSSSQIEIFIVDDDPDDQASIKEALAGILNNYRVTIANNGVECIQLLSQGFQPDLVFLDLNMPIKNGMECLREIQENRLVKDVPVVVYSTSSRPTDIESARKWGARFYMVKPNSGAGLVWLLERMVYMLGRSLKEQKEEENFVMRHTNRRSSFEEK